MRCFSNREITHTCVRSRGARGALADVLAHRAIAIIAIVRSRVRSRGARGALADVLAHHAGDDARADVVEMEPVREHVVPHHRVVITVIVVTARHPTPSRAIP